MEIQNSFLYGNILKVDLHGLSKEEAKAEIFHTLNSVDIRYDGIIFIHGYHGKNVLKNLVRQEIQHPIISKIVNLSAGETAYKIRK